MVIETLSCYIQFLVFLSNNFFPLNIVRKFGVESQIFFLLVIKVWCFLPENQSSHWKISDTYLKQKRISLTKVSYSFIKFNEY